MKRFGSFGVTALFAVLTCFALAPSAHAARAYPDAGPTFDLRVNRHLLYGGQRLVATATASVSCTWLLEWNGDRRPRTGKTFTTTYVAPAVTRLTRIPLHGTCFYDQQRARQHRAPARAATSATSTAEAIMVEVPPHWQQTIVITVLPPGSAVSPPIGGHPHPGGTGLPNTGGPSRWILLTGLGVLLAGSVVVRRAQADRGSGAVRT
jgi:LPXTG-motif cell wall-anchored protein